jgi:arginine/lysine/ornithine decarboxylase
MSIFASTSPSYLVLESLDLCNDYLCAKYPDELKSVLDKTIEVKDSLKKVGFVIENTDPLKIVINAEQSGIDGNELADILSDNKIEVEFADKFFVVLMVAVGNTENDFSSLLKVLSNVKLTKGLPTQKILKTFQPTAVMSIRDAVMSKSETVSVENSVGRICASPTVSCPPAVPIVISGEVITEEAVSEFLKYNIHKVDVVK